MREQLMIGGPMDGAMVGVPVGATRITGQGWDGEYMLVPLSPKVSLFLYSTMPSVLASDGRTTSWQAKTKAGGSGSIWIEPDGAS